MVRQNSTNTERWTRRKRITACMTACMRQQLFAPFSAHRYQFWASHTHISAFTYQFCGSQLSVFSTYLEIIVWNVTSRNKMLCNCKIRTWTLALCQFCIRKVISEKNNTLMKRSLPTKCTKFGAKICRNYWVITFLVLGHFFTAAPCISVIWQPLS